MARRSPKKQTETHISCAQFFSALPPQQLPLLLSPLLLPLLLLLCSCCCVLLLLRADACSLTNGSARLSECCSSPEIAAAAFPGVVLLMLHLCRISLLSRNRRRSWYCYRCDPAAVATFSFFFVPPQQFVGASLFLVPGSTSIQYLYSGRPQLRHCVEKNRLRSARTIR